MARTMSDNVMNYWRSHKQAFIDEIDDRVSVEPGKLCDYGVKALDDALFKIGKNELVVIGAETGCGKSELSLFIAQHNAAKGKTVGVYFLEGGYFEAMRRIKWRDMMDKFYGKYRKTIPRDKMIFPDYRKWILHDNQPELLKNIEIEVGREQNEKYGENLYFFPCDKDFTHEKLMMSLYDFQEPLSNKLHLDLIVIDHLQYFSLEKAENEITEITKILKNVKYITEHFNTPVILVSHLRKRGGNSGIPSHEDFYGSGNIAKISTTSIMISSATDKDQLSDNVFPTYFRIVKSRVGVRPNYAFLSDFNLTKRRYEDSYEIYKINSFGEVAEEPLKSAELPDWADGAKFGRKNYTGEVTVEGL